MVVMVFVQVHTYRPAASILSGCRTKPSRRLGVGSLRVCYIKTCSKVDILAREARDCGSTIMFNSFFHDGGASICSIEKLPRGIATSALAMVFCMALDTFPCEAAHAIVPLSTEADTPVSRPLASGSSKSTWDTSRLYKKSYLMQALLQNSDGGITSGSNASLVEENRESAADGSTRIMVDDGSTAVQQATIEKKNETLEDQNSIKKKIKWLNEVTSQITEELNDIHPPPLKGHVEQARGKVSTELSAISGSMSNVASDLKEGFIGLKDTIKSIASSSSSQENVSTSSIVANDDDNSNGEGKKDIGAAP